MKSGKKGRRKDQLTEIQTTQTGAIDSERLVVIFVLLLNSDSHKDQVEHIADAIEG